MLRSVHRLLYVSWSFPAPFDLRVLDNCVLTLYDKSVSLILSSSNLLLFEGVKGREKEEI